MTRLLCAVAFVLVVGCGEPPATAVYYDGGPVFLDAHCDAGPAVLDAGQGGEGMPDPCCVCAVEMGAAALDGAACVAWLEETDPGGVCLTEVCG